MFSQKSSFLWRLTCLSCHSSLSVYISRGPALYSKQDLRSHIFLFLFLVSHINSVCLYIPEGQCLCRRMLCTVCYDLPPRDLCGHSPPLKIEPVCRLTCESTFLLNVLYSLISNIVLFSSQITSSFQHFPQSWSLWLTFLFVLLPLCLHLARDCSSINNSDTW